MIELTHKRQVRLTGALLHDIGKFYASAEGEREKYADFTYRFLQESLNQFEALRPLITEIVSWSRMHLEETSETFGTFAEQLGRKEAVRAGSTDERLLLAPVVQAVDLGQKEIATERKYFIPGALTAESVFPDDSVGDNGYVQEQYRIAWQGFIREWNQIPGNLTFSAWYDLVYNLLEKWTSRINSTEKGFEPDISLFDHSRVVAAYSDCLGEAEESNKPFLIVEGDISGIQKFIYRLSNPTEGSQKKSSKTLRGRSLYVALLSDSVASYILEQVGLLKVHLLMNGGGHFHLIMPNTAKIRQQVNELSRQINEWLLDEFNGELGLILASAEFSAAEIVDYPKVKRHMVRLLTQNKEKKNFNLLDNPNVFGPYQKITEDEYWDVCKICGSDYKKNKDGTCPSCKHHQEVGGFLPKAHYLVRLHGKSEYNAKDMTGLFLTGLNTALLFFRTADDVRKYLAQNSSNCDAEVLCLNNTNFLNDDIIEILSSSSNDRIVSGFRFIGKYIPTDEQGEVMSFDALEQKDADDGYPLLHFLRMDVDNLGKIFAFGFKVDPQTEQNYYSLSRLASLSRELNLFFSGYLNILAEKHQIYMTYSGGDDLFVVGKWNKIIRFAQNVREDFKRFACSNPHFTISGGAALVRSGYPIRMAAVLAGEAEHAAKKASKEKNTINFFNQPYSWERFEQLIKWGNEMVDLVTLDEADKKYRNLVRYLKHLSQTYIKGNEDGLDWISKVKPKIHYMLKRRADITPKMVSAMEQENAALRTKVLARLIGDPKLMRDIGLPSDYMLLQTRKHKN